MWYIHPLYVWCVPRGLVLCSKLLVPPSPPSPPQFNPPRKLFAVSSDNFCLMSLLSTVNQCPDHHSTAISLSPRNRIILRLPCTSEHFQWGFLQISPYFFLTFLVRIEERVLNVLAGIGCCGAAAPACGTLCFWWSLLLFWLSSSRRGGVKVGYLHFETLRHLWGGICPFNANSSNPFPQTFLSPRNVIFTFLAWLALSFSSSAYLPISQKMYDLLFLAWLTFSFLL